jgi:FkbM family methyltransferase
MRSYLKCDIQTLFKNIDRKIRNLIILIKLVKNPIIVLLVYLGYIEEKNITLRNNRLVRIRHNNWGDDFLLMRMLSDLNVELNEDMITIKSLNISFSRQETYFAWQIYNNLKGLTDFKASRVSNQELLIEFKYNNRNLRFLIPIEWSGSFLEFYKYEAYSSLRINDCVVIDIGSSFGDTPLYFISKGAKFVIAVEPYERIYKYLVHNVNLNSVSDKVITMNKAVSSLKGVVKAFEGWTTLTAFPTDRVVTIESITLSELINLATKYGKCISVKMDCEGCEFEAIPEALESGALYNISDLIMEVHEKSHKKCIDLINLLKGKGFRVKVLNCVKQGRPYHRVCLVRVYREVTI